jgi:hypothetical protein
MIEVVGCGAVPTRTSAASVGWAAELAGESGEISADEKFVSGELTRHAFVCARTGVVRTAFWLVSVFGGPSGGVERLVSWDFFGLVGVLVGFLVRSVRMLRRWMTLGSAGFARARV